MDNVKNYLKTVFGKAITFIQKEQLVKNLTVDNIDCELLTFELIEGLNQYVLVCFEKKFDIRTKTIPKLISEIRKEVDAIPVLVFDELRINQRNVLVESGVNIFEINYVFGCFIIHNIILVKCTLHYLHHR